MVVEYQKILSQLYLIEESLSKKDMVEELSILVNLIRKVEYDIIDNAPITVGI